MHFWKNALIVVITYSFFFFIPWLGVFRLLAELADDAVISHWQNHKELSKKGNIGTFLLAIYLVLVAGEILTFRTRAFPFFVGLESMLILIYSIGFDLTSDLVVIIILGFCTFVKLCYSVWKVFFTKTSPAANNKDQVLHSVHLSLTDMQEVPIEDEDENQTRNQQ